MNRTRIFTLTLALALLIAALPAAAQSDNPMNDEVPLLVPEVIETRDHDAAAYTQGLLLHDGVLYESAGGYGESTLRRVDPESGEVLDMIEIDGDYFAEGLALVDDRLIQLTWQEEVAFIYDRETFAPVGTFDYAEEGWGLCYDGAYLYMSDGTPFIDIRDPETFELLFSLTVTVQGSPVPRLNELECVGDTIYANVYRTDVIVRINKENGVVTGIIDASGLLTDDERAELASDEVLNGIAYDPDADTFLITGKHWPHLYEVRFVEAAPEE